jgi:2-(1,2-epoxy-1,2-dihydrophenyl)acetyl-CoA isomerase
MEPLSYEQILTEARRSQERLVQVERHPGYAIVRLNHPTTLNALSVPLTLQLLDALRALMGDQEITSIVLTGADPAFSAGGDLHAMERVVHPLVDTSPEGAVSMWRWIRAQFGGVVRLIMYSDKVFVAAVNGACAGVGWAFVLACDLIIASQQARFVSAFGRIGLLPEVGTSWHLSRRIGYHKAFELFVSGRAISAEEALALELVNEVVPHEALLPTASAWCERITRLPSHAVALTKPLLRQSADLSWEQALTMEEFAEPMCFTTAAHRQGVRSVLEHHSSSTPS